MNRRYAEAASVLGLRPTGVETLPDALLGAGLARRLHARRTGRVQQTLKTMTSPSDSAGRCGFGNEERLAEFLGSLSFWTSARSVF